MAKVLKHGTGDTSSTPKNKNLVVFGIYPNRERVETAVEELRINNFRHADISVLFPSPETTREFAHRKETKAPEGATTGGVIGAITGGTLGWLAGIGAIAIPGVGPFIAAGPIVGLLAGTGAVGVAGGLIGGLIGLGIPEYEAKRYEGRIKEGGILLSVHCDIHEWKNKAKDILNRTGGQDVDSTGEAGSDKDLEAPPRAFNE